MFVSIRIRLALGFTHFRSAWKAANFAFNIRVRFRGVAQSRTEENGMKENKKIKKHTI